MVKKETQPAVVQEVTSPVIHQEPTGLAPNISAHDLRLPRIALLQALSPQLNENDKLRAGMFYNTLLQEEIPAPLVFTPIFAFRNAIKYNPREQGGGIIYKTTNFTPEVIKDCQWDGLNKPVATEFVNAVVLVENFDIPLIVSFSKTSLNAGKDLLTFITLSRQAWKFNYVLESHKTIKNNNTFYVMRVKRGKASDADTIIEASSLYDSVKGMSLESVFEEEEHIAPTADGTPSEF